jgi:predicted RNA-binding Zn ribbon-like protein
MAAVFLDIDGEDPNDETTPIAPEITDSFAEPVVETPPEDDLPEKYRNKSAKEIAAMHQEAEKLLGRHSQEVGELRKVVDTYIQSQLVSKSEPEEEIDFFEDPQKAVSKAIEKHPLVQEARQNAQQYKHQTALSTLQQKHPDMVQVLSNPKFSEWVAASPVRRELYERADKNFDFDSADELISNFKEKVAIAQQTVNTEVANRQQQVKAASTGSATGTSAPQGSKRIYRRADIIKLIKTDPDRYEALSDEISRAYMEGRVR